MEAEGANQRTFTDPECSVMHKPAKRREAIVGGLIAAAVSFAAGWFLNK